MNASARAFLVFLLGCLGLVAPCSANDPRIDWTCWLHSDQMQAVCMVLAAPQASAHERVTPRLASTTGLSPRQFLQVVRERPADLGGSPVFVPLLTVAEDETRIAELVKAVLCGSNLNCEARYQHDMAKLFANNPEFFVDMNAVLWEGQPV